MANDFFWQYGEEQKENLMKRRRYETGNAQKGNVRLNDCI